jgi:hypothetical protein
MVNRTLILKKSIIGIMLLSLITIVMVISSSAKGDNPDEIVLNLSFEEPTITEWNISNITYHNVTMNNTYTIGGIGLPLLPMKPLRILLPQNGTFESINITYAGNTSLGNGYNVTLGTNESESQQNESKYNTSKPYPTLLYNNSRIDYFRGYSILSFSLHPVYYIGDTGEIYYYKNMTVIINTIENNSVNSYFRGLEKDEKRMQHVFIFILILPLLIT